MLFVLDKQTFTSIEQAVIYCIHCTSFPTPVHNFLWYFVTILNSSASNVPSCCKPMRQVTRYIWALNSEYRRQEKRSLGSKLHGSRVKVGFWMAQD